jgi:stearoyl-CoA 9-desaturase NADPH oxidoreductase
MTVLAPSRPGAGAGSAPPVNAGAGARRERWSPIPAALLRLAAAVTTPLVPSDYLDMMAPLRSGADLRGRVVEVRPETSTAVTVRIRPGRGWRGHIAGQYIRIGVDVDGVRHWRAYSLTSPTSALDGLVSITVKAIPNGVVSNHIVRRLRVGELVHLDQATGDFTLPENRPAKVLFLTAGSGITPVMGMLRSHADELGDIALVHSAPRAADVVFGQELRNLGRAGRLELVERHTDVDGLLTSADLDTVCPDWSDRQTWACGPAALLDDAEAHWAQAGLSELLHTERFRPSVVVPGEGGRVLFTGTGTVVDVDGSTTLLDAGESAGVLMPSGCRMGICFGCVLPLREGAVRDLRNGELTTAAPGDGVRIQTCVSAAAGACEIEL